MVIWSLGFIMERIHLCQAGLSVLSAASDQVIQTPGGRVPLFINLPSWLAPRQNGFALGHEGYLLLPEYTGTGLYDFVFANTGQKRESWVRSVPDIRRPWKALIGYYGDGESLGPLADGLRRADSVWVLGYTPQRLELLEVGEVRPGASATTEDLAIFGEAVRLKQVSLRATESGLRLDISWQSVHRLEPSYTVFLHVYTRDGRIVTQGDGLPLGGTFAFRSWMPGDAVHDIRYVQWPAEMEAGEYVLGAGLYRSDTGERAPAVDGSGKALQDAMFRMEVSFPMRSAKFFGRGTT